MAKVLVTGGRGFLGKHVVRELQSQKYDVLSTEEYDLTNKDETKRQYDATKPDVVIHLAAKVGGISENIKSPAEFYRNNLAIGMNVIHEGWKAGVKKIVNVGTVCSYPSIADMPFKEESLWNGRPDDTVRYYGLAKRAIIDMAIAYHKQYGMNITNLLQENLYGPGDHFGEERAHVIPALIERFYKAKQNKTVEVWGSGKASREFLYVEDAAKAIVQAIDWPSPDPINLGSGMEITISELANKISSLIGYKGEIVFDTSKPDGQMKRSYDLTKVTKLGFKAETDFDKGLHQTIQWYVKT